MLSRELGYWWADLVLELQQTLPQRVGEQVFISELTQNSCAIGAAQVAVAMKHRGATGNS